MPSYPETPHPSLAPFFKTRHKPGVLFTEPLCLNCTQKTCLSSCCAFIENQTHSWEIFATFSNSTFIYFHLRGRLCHIKASHTFRTPCDKGTRIAAMQYHRCVMGHDASVMTHGRPIAHPWRVFPTHDSSPEMTLPAEYRRSMQSPGLHQPLRYSPIFLVFVFPEQRNSVFTKVAQRSHEMRQRSGAP